MLSRKMMDGEHKNGTQGHCAMDWAQFWTTVEGQVHEGTKRERQSEHWREGNQTRSHPLGGGDVA